MNKPIQLEHFQGPLDLLLQLIEQNELEITTVAISEVTEQFVAYLDEVEERYPDELADFLVIATRLLLLKSHALLPYLHLEGEEEDPGELEAQLKMYKKYLDAMGGLEELLAANRTLFPKPASSRPLDISFRPPALETLGTDRLAAIFTEVLAGLEPIVRIPKAAIAKVVTVREKFCQIQELLENGMRLHFKELLADSRDKAEIVVTFLALLELVKKQAICVSQENHLADIYVEKA